MDVVDAGVGIFDDDFLAGLDREDLRRHTEAAFWSSTAGGALAPVDLPVTPFNETTTSASSPFGPTT
jgi:hypothetical protein